MMNEQKGFNLNYAELSLFAPVDPYFDLTATLPFSSDGVELEEAFFTTRSLPWGFQLKGGKFRSSIGRLNVQHPHVWDFADAPLVNRAFFGSDGLVEAGAQVNWLAPTPFYLLLGRNCCRARTRPVSGPHPWGCPRGTTPGVWVRLKNRTCLRPF